jgi:hypothetical protein
MKNWTPIGFECKLCMKSYLESYTCRRPLNILRVRLMIEIDIELICCQIVVVVLAVEQQEVSKGLWRTGILLKQKLKLFKTLGRHVCHVHQGLAHIYHTY